MDITPHGFVGTLDESHWAQLAALMGVSSSVASSGDFKVTPVSGVRRVAIAPGLAYAPGVLADAEEAGTLDLPEPASGQWYVIVLRRNWTTHTIDVAYVPGSITSNVVPTAPPTSFPALNGSSGQLHDQKLAWAWVHNTTKNVVVFDLRVLRIDQRPDPDPSWSAVTEKPTTFPPSSHAYSSHTGTVPVTDGGTGSTTASAARTALGITPANIGASAVGHSHNGLAGSNRTYHIEAGGKSYIFDPDGPTYYWTIEASGTLSRGIVPFDRLSDLPATWKPTAHNHQYTEVFVNGVQINEWARANFAELSHSHSASAISDSGNKGRQILRLDTAEEVRASIGASADGHTHNGTYYTEAEVNTKLATKASSSHYHDYGDIRGFAAGASVNIVDWTRDNFAPASHTHNGTYYTEAEVNAKLATKAASSHTHSATQVSTSNANVQVDINSLSNRIDAKQSSTGTFSGAGVNTGGNVVAGGDIGCTGRMQSKGSRNFQVSSNYVSAYLDANGYMGYAPSVRAMKQDIVPWEIDRDAFMAIKPVTFRYRSSVGKLGDKAPVETGFIADDFLNAGLAQFTFNDPETGIVSGLAYERLTTALWSIVQQQQTQIDGLVTDVTALKETAGAGA